MCVCMCMCVMCACACVRMCMCVCACVCVRVECVHYVPWVPPPACVYVVSESQPLGEEFGWWQSDDGGSCQREWVREMGREGWVREKGREGWVREKGREGWQVGFHWEDVAKQQWPTSAGRRDIGRRAQSPSHSVHTVRERQVILVHDSFHPIPTWIQMSSSLRKSVTSEKGITNRHSSSSLQHMRRQVSHSDTVTLRIHIIYLDLTFLSVSRTYLSGCSAAMYRYLQINFQWLLSWLLHKWIICHRCFSGDLMQGHLFYSRSQTVLCSSC